MISRAIQKNHKPKQSEKFKTDMQKFWEAP